MDCPLLVWMLTLNRNPTPAEYDASYKIVKECVKWKEFDYQPTSADSFRELMSQMLPLLMMRHRRISRQKWRDCMTPSGKHWIEQSPDDMPPEKFLRSMIGYHLTWNRSLCGMVMTQGAQKQVINVGLGIERLVPEGGVPHSSFIQSFFHKLTESEQASLQLSSEVDEEKAINRLAILLALKTSYTRAVGQPAGFDLSRLSFDVPNRKVLGDGHPLTGWEFRVFVADLSVMRTEGRIIKEKYQCAAAFFRGTDDTRFVWHETVEELNKWVQFITIDQMVKVIPKLLA